MNLLWMLTNNSTLEEQAKNIWAEDIMPIVNLVIWILVILLAVVFIVKAVTTALAVMKAADEPQVRQEKLNGFKYLAIGLGVAIVVLSLANVIMKLVTDNQVKLSNESTLLF